MKLPIFITSLLFVTQSFANESILSLEKINSKKDVAISCAQNDYSKLSTEELNRLANRSRIQHQNQLDNVEMYSELAKDAGLTASVSRASALIGVSALGGLAIGGLYGVSAMGIYAPASHSLAPAALKGSAIIAGSAAVYSGNNIYQAANKEIDADDPKVFSAGPEILMNNCDVSKVLEDLDKERKGIVSKFGDSTWEGIKHSTLNAATLGGRAKGLTKDLLENSLSVLYLYKIQEQQASLALKERGNVSQVNTNSERRTISDVTRGNSDLEPETSKSIGIN